MLCSSPTLDIPWTLISTKSIGNGLGRRRRKKKLWTQFNQVRIPPGITIRRPLLSAWPCRPSDFVWIPTMVIPSCTAIEAHSIENNGGDKPPEEEVAMDGSRQTDGSALLDEGQDLSFEEFGKLSEALIVGGLGQGDGLECIVCVEKDIGLPKGEGGFLEGFKSEINAGSGVLEEFVQEAEDKIGVLVAINSEAEDENRALEGFTNGIGVESRVLEAFNNGAGAESRVLEGFQNGIGAERRILVGFRSKVGVPSIVSQEKKLESVDEFLFAEHASREFKEGFNDGAEAESSVLEVVRAKIGDEGGVLKVETSIPLDSKQNAEGSTLRELKCETGVNVRVLNGRKNDRMNDVEIRFEQQNLLQSRTVDRVSGEFKEDVKADGWVLRGGIESRTNVEVRFSGHTSSRFQAEGRPFPEFKSKTKGENRVFKREILQCKTVGEVGFGHQNRQRLEAGGMVLGESNNKTEAGSSFLQSTEVKARCLEVNIFETRVNTGRQVVTALKNPMQKFEDKIGGEDRIMPKNRTPIECFEKENKIDGKIMPADGIKHNHKQLKQGLMINCNRDTSIEHKLIVGKHSLSHRPVQSNLRSRKMGQKSGIETRRSHKSYGGCIPSILQALESIEDIDKALQPWEANLGAKERSIILKEQCNWHRALMIFERFQSQQCYEMNAIHYNIMLRILGRAQKWDQLKKLWDEMAKDNVLPTNTTYGTLIDVYGKAGLKEEALWWLDRMKMQGLQPDEVTMNTVVHIFKKAGRKDSSFMGSHVQGRIQFQDQMDQTDSLLNPFLGAPSTTSILDNKAMCPCSENVQAQRPHSSYTYNTLIDMYGKAGRLKDASNAFCEMLKEGIIPNTVTFNTMIHICGSHGYLEEADALMMKMEELRCLPDTRTYNTLIALHAKNDKIDIASGYFTKMKAAGLCPDNVSYRTLLYAFCIRHMVSEAESVVQEMDELGIHVDEFSQSAAIRMYIDLGLLQRAWAWFERFHICGGMSSECYAANIDAYGEQGYWLEAEKVFSCSQERRTKPSILEFNTMIKAYGIAKVHEKALKLFESMESQGMVPDQCTYKSLIQMLASAELLDEARCFLTRMQEAGFMPGCSPFCAVIAANGRLGRATEAEEIYKDMLKAGVEPDVVVYGALINAFAEAGRMEEAVHYFQVMQDAGLAGNSVVYNSLIKVYAKVGCLKEAEETYKKMEKLSDVPDVFSSNCMIELYTTAGMVSEAQAIFKDLKENGHANEFSFSMMLCLYKNNGRFNDAFEIAKEMQESGLLTNALSFNNVIGLYATDGRLREATEIFQQMLKSGVTPDDSTYKTLCTILKKGGIPKEVVHRLDIARECGIQHSMEALIVTLYSMVGMHDEALEACDKFRGVGFEFDASAYNAAIYAFSSAGRIDEAVKMFMSMQSKGLEPDVATYTSMIIGYGKVGLLEGVKRMFYKMKQKGFEPNVFTFKAVIDAYKSVGRLDLAKLVTQEMGFAHHLQEHNNFM